MGAASIFPLTPWTPCCMAWRAFREVKQFRRVRMIYMYSWCDSTNLLNHEVRSHEKWWMSVLIIFSMAVNFKTTTTYELWVLLIFISFIEDSSYLNTYQYTNKTWLRAFWQTGVLNGRGEILQAVKIWSTGLTPTGKERDRWFYRTQKNIDLRGLILTTV